MGDFIADTLGTIVGCLIAGYIFYGIVNIILFKFIDKKILPFVSFIGSSILVLVVTSYLIGFVPGFVRYIPAIFVWFVVDLIKANKKKVTKIEGDSGKGTAL